MNILILHDTQALREALPAEQTVAASVSIRDINSANLAQLLSTASIVALAGPVDLAASAWAEVLAQLRQLEIPTVALGLVHQAVDAACMSGSCKVSQNPNGTLEVSCAAQQEAMSRMNAMLRGGAAVGRNKRRRATRFFFNGD